MDKFHDVLSQKSWSSRHQQRRHVALPYMPQIKILKNLSLAVVTLHKMLWIRLLSAERWGVLWFETWNGILSKWFTSWNEAYKCPKGTLCPYADFALLSCLESVRTFVALSLQEIRDAIRSVLVSFQRLHARGTRTNQLNTAWTCFLFAGMCVRSGFPSPTSWDSENGWWMIPDLTYFYIYRKTQTSKTWQCGVK